VIPLSSSLSVGSCFFPVSSLFGIQFLSFIYNELGLSQAHPPSYPPSSSPTSMPR
jgi:hypothetical protein